MDEKEYKKHLEKKLIDEFVKNFNEKIGYSPIIITKKQMSLHKKITLSNLESYFEEYLPKVPNIKIVSLGSKMRKRNLVELRFIFFHIAKKLNYTLCEIGNHVGKRDHSTVLYGLRVFKDLYETDNNFKLLYNDIITKIKNDLYDTSDMEHLDQMEYKSESDLFYSLL